MALVQWCCGFVLFSYDTVEKCDKPETRWPFPAMSMDPPQRLFLPSSTWLQSLEGPQSHLHQVVNW